MLKLAGSLDAEVFIICTEVDMMHRLRKENPGKIFHTPCADCICQDMKKTDPDRIINSLENMEYPVEVPRDIRIRAYGAIEKMVSTLDSKERMEKQLH